MFLTFGIPTHTTSKAGRYVTRVLAPFLTVSATAGILFLANGAPAAQLRGQSQAPTAEVVQQALEDFHGSDRKGKDGPLAKAGLELAVLKNEHAQHAVENARRANPVPFVPSDETLTIVNGEFIVVDAVAKGNPEQLKNELVSLGMVSAEAAGNFVSGLLPIASIDEAAQLSTLSFLRGAQAMALGGVTMTQGDAAQFSDNARNMRSVTGAGIRVGVMSDSYDNHRGNPATRAADDIANGDLPSDIIVLDNSIRGYDEGRAMMQIVHDIAPGAALAFHSAFGGQANFANGIRELADAGCNVIVDDVFYYGEPMFQDGIIAQAIDDVVSNGAAYFSSAGNSARKSYEAPFRNSGQTGPVSGGLLHDFDPGSGVDTKQSVRVPVGTRITVVLNWDQPYSSLGGEQCQSDIDFFLTDKAGNLIAYAASANIGGDPIEILTFQNSGTIDVDGTPGADTMFDFGIERYSGEMPGLMKYVYYGSNGSPTIYEYHTNSSTLFGHANAAGAEAVGAAFYYNTPRFGSSTPVLQGYSSAGGMPVLFDKAGNKFATALYRNKPEIVAPDGGNNSFFGNDIGDIGGTDGDSYPNFFGTSAASPHAAGVAALILESNPYMSPGEVYLYMEGGAIDMSSSRRVSSEYNYDAGNGFVDAYNSFPAPLYVELVDFSASSEGIGQQVTIAWSTGLEIDNVGFNVYRAKPGGRPGEWRRGERINASLIAAEGNESSGASYELVDSLSMAEGESRGYLLEDIDMNGSATLHGPAFVEVRREAASSVSDWMQYE